MESAARSACQSGAILPEPQHRLLRHVLGLRRLAQHPPRQREDARRVPRGQRARGRLVPRGIAREEGGVGRLGGGPASAPGLVLIARLWPFPRRRLLPIARRAPEGGARAAGVIRRPAAPGRRGRGRLRAVRVRGRAAVPRPRRSPAVRGRACASASACGDRRVAVGVGEGEQEVHPLAGEVGDRRPGRPRWRPSSPAAGRRRLRPGRGRRGRGAPPRGPGIASTISARSSVPSPLASALASRSVARATQLGAAERAVAVGVDGDEVDAAGADRHHRSARAAGRRAVLGGGHAGGGERARGARRRRSIRDDACHEASFPCLIFARSNARRRRLRRAAVTSARASGRGRLAVPAREA